MLFSDVSLNFICLSDVFPIRALTIIYISGSYGDGNYQVLISLKFFCCNINCCIEAACEKKIGCLVKSTPKLVIGQLLHFMFEYCG